MFQLAKQDLSGENKQFLEKFYDHIDVEIAIYDDSFNYLYVNPIMVPEKNIRRWIVGKNDLKLCEKLSLDLNIAQRRIEILQRVKNEKKIIDFEETIIFLNGEKRHYYRKIRPFLNNNGNVENYIVSGTDITKKVIDQEEHRLLLLNTIDQNEKIVMITDIDGTLEYVNPKFTEVSGYGTNEVIGKNANILKSGYSSLDDYKVLWETIISGKLWRGTFQNKSKAGNLYWVSSIIGSVKNSEGVITHYIDIQYIISDQINSKLLSRAVEQSTNYIIITNTYGEIEYVNPKFTEITGYSFEEALGKNPSLLKSGYTSDEEYEELWEKISSGKTWTGIFQNKAKNGDLYWGSAGIAPVVNDNGKITHYVCTVEDITDIKNEELTKIENMEKYRNILDNTTDGIITINEQGFIEIFNISSEEIFGYEAREVVGKHITMLMPEQNKKDFNIKFENIELTDKLKEGVELAGRRRDGSIFQAELRISKFIMKEQVMFTTLVRDITKINMMKNALKESEEKYRNLFEFALEGIFISDPITRKILDVNHIAIDRLGYTRDELLSMKIDNLARSIPEDVMKSNIARITRGEKIVIETIHTSKDGKELDVEINSHVAKIGNQQVILTFARDISERKKQEEIDRKLREEFHQSQKMNAIGNLAGGVAHDFNNLLTVIMASTEILNDSLSEDVDSLELINQINKASTRAADLTKSLLSMARRNPAKFEQIDINNLIEEVIGILERTIKKTITISTEFDQKPTFVLGDKSQLYNVLFNIALNARDAMPAGGKLIFSTKIINPNEEQVTKKIPELNTGDYIRICISDTGIGMDDITLSQIFEPFFTTKGPGLGTGLGLALIYDIVSNHNGKVSVTSAPNQGTEFDLYLPLLSDHVSIETSVLPDTRKTKARHIMIIDDEKEVLNVTSKILLKEGYKVSASSNSLEAIHTYQKNCAVIDLVILDLNMPDMDGWAVLTELKKINPSVKILIFTGYLAISEDYRLKDPAVKGIINKPFKVRELLELINQTIP